MATHGQQTAEKGIHVAQNWELDEAGRDALSLTDEDLGKALYRTDTETLEWLTSLEGPVWDGLMTQEERDALAAAGDVVGPGSSTAGSVAKFSDTSGAVLAECSFTESDIETALTKLAGVEEGATANSTDAQLRDRTTHTGTQAISTVTGLQTALDGKTDGPASSVTARIATFNGTTGKLLQDGGSTIANVLDRANHTGTQAQSTITNLTTDLAAKAAKTSIATESGTTRNAGTSGDDEKTVRCTNAAGCTVTIPTGLSVGWTARYYATQGQVTLSTSGLTVEMAATFLAQTNEAFSALYVTVVASNTILVEGDLAVAP